MAGQGYFHPAPGWPAPPPGWSPPPGWQPDPSWPPPPPGWRVWEKNEKDVEVRIVAGDCVKCGKPSGSVYAFDCVAYNKTPISTSTVDDRAANRTIITTRYQIHDVTHFRADVCTDCVAQHRKSLHKAGIVLACCLPLVVGLIALFASLGDTVTGFADVAWFIVAVLALALGPILTLTAPVLLYEGSKKHVSLDFLMNTFKADLKKGRTQSDLASLYTFSREVSTGTPRMI